MRVSKHAIEKAKSILGMEEREAVHYLLSSLDKAVELPIDKNRLRWDCKDENMYLITDEDKEVIITFIN